MSFKHFTDDEFFMAYESVHHKVNDILKTLPAETQQKLYDNGFFDDSKSTVAKWIAYRAAQDADKTMDSYDANELAMEGISNVCDFDRAEKILLREQIRK